MCTVTIIPKKNNDFVLTSNRDEAPCRISLAPDFYHIDNTKLLFPKDVISNGTWIGISDKNRVVCLLNGGFKSHIRKQYYIKSRGLVVNDFMTSSDLIETIENYNFTDIEPFTMVVVDWNIDLKFFELVWDGNRQYFTRLPLEAKIWSSSTLYSEFMRNERLNWFQDFKSENNLESKTILNFHKKAGSNNDEYGVIMNRGFIKTTSITQITKENNTLEMHYESLENNIISSKIFNLPLTINE